MISEFLFYEDDVDKTEKSNYIDLKIQIRELLKNEFNRKVLTEILLDLRKDVSGDTKVRLFKLYQDLGLEKDAFEKLESWRWEVISKGISHLTQMHVASAYSFITKFINHRKSTIRKQAEIAIVTLKAEGINYFLDTTRYKISEWQQVKLLEVIRNQEDLDPPRFKMWLTSNNKHVVLFALRLIKYYNQNDANTSLIELVKHKNNQIKAEALNCIKEFNVVEALPILKQVFSKCNVDIKIGILGAIGDLGSSSDVSFLKEISQREGNFSVKSKALSAVNMIQPDTIMPTEGIESIGTYVEPDAVLENQKEAISPDALEEINTETPLENPFMNTGGLNEELTDSEIRNQKEAFLEKDEDSVGQIQKTENDVASNLEVTKTASSGVLSEIENIEHNVEEEKISNGEDILENITTEQVENALVDSEEITNQSSDIETDEIASIPHGPISKSFEKNAHIATEQPSNNSQNLNFFHLDFIPIITTENSNPDQTLEKYHPMANAKNPELDLKNIKVDFEEVVSHKLNQLQDTETEHFDISEISFLPVVVDIDDTNQKVERSEVGEDIENSPMDLEVFYEEIQGLPMDNELHNLITEINELNFLPIVVDEEIEVKSELELDDIIKSEISDTVNDIDGYTLADFEVDFEESSTPIKDETVGFDLKELPIIDNQGPAIDDVMSWLMEHNELREIEIQYEIVSADKERSTIADLLPEPIYYDEHEAYMMGLLDDLEELGDSREIPFLEELLAVEKKSFIIDRITHLINRFSVRRDGRKPAINEDGKEKAELPRFSVFADLFKSIDTESKLILLDEIVAVGDAKEIDFLDAILEDPHPGIRKKAQESLKLLIAKISGATTLDAPKKKQEVEELPSRLFDVHKPGQKFKKDTKPVNDDSLLETKEIQPHTDTEIFDIDFELAEVLDKGYSNQILNLPVIATEVSPNGASLIFQINNMIKKFNG